MVHILTSSIWCFCFDRVLRAGVSSTSRVEGSSAQLPLSFLHVPALRLLFLTRNLLGQAQRQTRQLWMNRLQNQGRLLVSLQKAVGLPLQLLEDFLSFFPDETQNKSRVCPRVCACSRGVKLCWPLLGFIEVHMGDVREEGNGGQIVNRARQEIFLTAMLFHQRVGLTRVKEDLIRGHQQDTWNHTLKQQTTEVSPVKVNNTRLEDIEGTLHRPCGLWCSGRAV